MISLLLILLLLLLHILLLLLLRPPLPSWLGKTSRATDTKEGSNMKLPRITEFAIRRA
jgi:hypothetical protein